MVRCYARVQCERDGKTPTVLDTDGEKRESRDASVRMRFDNPADCVSVANMIVDAPTAPGVWRRTVKETNSSWELYPFTLAENIFISFCDGRSYFEWVDFTPNARKRKRDAEDDTSDFGIAGATHRLYFETMREVELLTGMEIDVSIVQAAISSINYMPIEDPIEAGVWWKDDSGKWNCYGEVAVHDIRKACSRKDKFVILKEVCTAKYPRGIQYIVNLTQMEQTNPMSGRVRPIKIVSNERMPPEISPPNAACSNLTVFSLGKDLVRSSLKILLSREFINSAVATMVLAPYDIVAIEPSKHLKDDSTHLLYQKFRHAYETIIKCVPGCCGQLTRISRRETLSTETSFASDHSASRETKPILRHVFYLPPPSQIDNIFEAGLPSRHNIEEENFAFLTDYYQLYHKSWEKSTYSLLMFLVVDPRCSNGSLNGIPVASVDHQLPIAKVTLRIPETKLSAHESHQSGVTDSNHYDDQTAYDDNGPQALCSSTIEPEVLEISTRGGIRTKQLLLPSKLGGDILLLFKLYCPKTEKLRFVGARAVPIGGRPTQILQWLREIAGLATDLEIRLYTEDSATIIDPNFAYEESGLEDASVLAYNSVLTTNERSCHRYPDFPTFRHHLLNRQVMHFRKLSNPTVDEFCLALSKQDTYSDVADRVAQYLGLGDDSCRIRLTLNDRLLQGPKFSPLESSFYSKLVANAYTQTASILYYQVFDTHLPELDGSKILKIAFHSWKGEELSVHDIELAKRKTVKDAVEELKGMVKELLNPTQAEMRIFEVHSNRISRIHPANEKIGYISNIDNDWPVKTSLRAVEIPEEDKDVGPHDLLIHVRHFHRRGNSSRKWDFFGEPFLMVVRGHETLAHLKERIKDRVQMLDTELLECKFALLYAGRREYLHVDDLVERRMQQISLGFYDPVLYSLGLEHVNSSNPLTLPDVRVNMRSSERHEAAEISEPAERPLKSTGTPQSSQAESVPMSYYLNTKVDTLQSQGPTSGFAGPSKQLTKSKTDNRSTQVREDCVKELALTVVDPPNHGSPNSISPALMSSASCLPSPDQVPRRNLPRILVPDPEFHDFDSRRREVDVVVGQVWAIYDNHDGMPRFYGLVTRVAHSPFQVELSWLEPNIIKRWWVESTGLSITVGEFEISGVSDVETDIGVFSHLVLETVTPSIGVIRVYPRKGEVWAIFSNWDLSRVIGPKPILTPNGIFKQCYEYNIVKMLDDYSAEHGVRVVELLKTKGFKTIFHPLGRHASKIYHHDDLRKFSHKIPAETMDNIKVLLPNKGTMELDPASLPSE